MSTELVAYTFSNEQIKVMKATVAQGTSDAEFALFLEVCKHRKLNPFNREIYVIPNKGKMTFQVSIDGLRLLAERSGKYQGQLGPFWCGKDGEWREVWLEDAPPAAAKVGVIRSDFKEPIFSVAKFKSYQGNSPIWQKMPDLMLAKCAESLALRRAFPDQMAGLYTKEEMEQSQDDLPAQVLASETAVVDSLTIEFVQKRAVQTGIAKTRTEWQLFNAEVLTEFVPDEKLKNDPEKLALLNDTITARLAA